MALGDSAQTNGHAAPPPAVPVLHDRTCKAKRPVPHTVATLRSRQCTSKSGRRRPSPSKPPNLSLRAGGWVLKTSPDASPWPIDRGSSNDAKQFSFRVRSDSNRNQPYGTLRSSVVHSPGRASSNPLAWLASLQCVTTGNGLTILLVVTMAPHGRTARSVGK